MNFESLFIFSPDKRIFFMYLFSSMVLGFLVLSFSKNYKKSFVHSLEALFHPKVWFHQSAKLDYKLFLFNTFFKGGLFTVVTLTSVAIALWGLEILNDLFPNFQPKKANYSTVMIIYTLVSFIVLDFSRFIQHYFMHKVPFLWRFHEIHHSAEVLTPMTLYRTHPVESLISALRRILVMGLLSMVFLFCFQSVIGGVEVLGINVLSFAFNMLGSNLRHSHVWLSFGPLNYIFISPAQHQIHHSRNPKHFDKNLGTTFALWDHIFGTFYHPKKRENLIFGVRGRKHRALRDAIQSPFSNIG